LPNCINSLLTINYFLPTVMKKNTVKVMLLMSLLGSSFTLFAQSAEAKKKILANSYVEAGAKLTQRLDAEFKEKHAEAIKLAEINGWPLTIKNEDGRGDLMYVSEEGAPIYYGTFNVGSAITSRSNWLHPGGGLGLNLTGFSSNDLVGQMYVGMWDGQYPLVTHLDFANRIDPGDTGVVSNVQQHPTHVMGTMIGSGATDAEAKGIAYQAYGIASNYDNDLAEMGDQNEFLGMIISNHSYGLIASQVPSYYFGAYIDKSRNLDEMLFDYPYYQPVIAAGNDNNGTSYDLLTSMGTSKNAVVVAAVNEVNTFNADGTPTSVSLASFSNWGPTDDNRIKPDISSKGTNVYSTSNGSNTAHATLQGTSMAAPGITGAFTLIQQYYAEQNEGTFMRSATLRALMAHTADECGTNPGPDARFGWGLMNAKKCVETITNQGVSSIIEENVLLPGQTYTFAVTAIGNQPVIATLAWTDPAGVAVTSTTSSARLVNNLDIKVTKGSTTYRPWKLGTSNSAAAVKGENNVDNIEKVEIAEASGAYTITVSHKGTTLVNPNGTPSQQYSLVVTGVGEPVSVGQVAAEMFSIWPNPAADVLNVRLTAGFESGASVKIYDIQGRVMLQQSLTGMETVVNTQSLSSGVYFVDVLNGGKNQVKKVVIE